MKHKEFFFLFSSLGYSMSQENTINTNNCLLRSLFCTLEIESQFFPLSLSFLFSLFLQTTKWNLLPDIKQEKKTERNREKEQKKKRKEIGFVFVCTCQLIKG